MKRKKLTSVLCASAVTVSMILAMTSCGNNDSAEGSSDSVVSTVEETESIQESTEEIALEESSEEPSAEQEDEDIDEVKVEAGTVIEYKMAYYFDESVASNEADVIKKVVQNISKNYESITDESLLNDKDTYQLFWAAEKGATLTIPIEVPAGGKYDIKLSLHTGGDFGTHEIYIGDTLITESGDIDLYSAEGGLADFELGEFELPEGETELLIRCTGQNEASAGSVFGISTMTLTNKEID